MPSPRGKRRHGTAWLAASYIASRVWPQKVTGRSVQIDTQTSGIPLQEDKRNTAIAKQAECRDSFQKTEYYFFSQQPVQTKNLQQPLRDFKSPAPQAKKGSPRACGRVCVFVCVCVYPSACHFFGPDAGDVHVRRSSLVESTQPGRSTRSAPHMHGAFDLCGGTVAG